MIFPLIDEFVVIQYINFQPMSHFFKNGWVLPIWDPRHGPSLRPRFGPSDLGGALHPLGGLPAEGHDSGGPVTISGGEKYWEKYELLVGGFKHNIFYFP